MIVKTEAKNTQEFVNLFDPSEVQYIQEACQTFIAWEMNADIDPDVIEHIGTARVFQYIFKNPSDKVEIDLASVSLALAKMLKSYHEFMSDVLSDAIAYDEPDEEYLSDMNNLLVTVNDLISELMVVTHTEIFNLN